MKDEPLPGEGAPPPSKLRAWGNALVITLLGCLLAGLGCFVLLANYLWQQIESQQLDLFHAAAWWEVGFTVAMAIILGVIIVWQRARGSSLAELGWGKPTPAPALVLAVLLGVAFLGSSYFGARSVLRAGSPVNATERSSNAAAAASPPRDWARPAERSSSHATSSSGPGVAAARWRALAPPLEGSISSASVGWALLRSEGNAEAYAAARIKG